MREPGLVPGALKRAKKALKRAGHLHHLRHGHNCPSHGTLSVAVRSLRVFTCLAEQIAPVGRGCAIHTTGLAELRAVVRVSRHGVGDVV